MKPQNPTKTKSISDIGSEVLVKMIVPSILRQPQSPSLRSTCHPLNHLT
jgi:hypothetical protein